jgi:hypothetical protein
VSKILPAADIYGLLSLMETTIDLPETLLERTNLSAANRQTTMRELVIEGLEKVLTEEAHTPSKVDTKAAVERLRKGYHLGNQPLTREECHAR